MLKNNLYPVRAILISSLFCQATFAGQNLVRLCDNSLCDDDGAMLGLGATYMQAMYRCKFDRPRFESDLSFLAANGFNYVRILTMVGWYDFWEGFEIAPVSFNTENGLFVPAWPDYWQQFRD